MIQNGGRKKRAREAAPAAAVPRFQVVPGNLAGAGVPGQGPGRPRADRLTLPNWMAKKGDMFYFRTALEFMMGRPKIISRFQGEGVYNLIETAPAVLMAGGLAVGVPLGMPPA